MSSKKKSILTKLIFVLLTCQISVESLAKITPGTRANIRQDKPSVRKGSDDLELEFENSDSSAPNWVRIPEEFIPYIQSVYGASPGRFEYETTKPFLRRFRINEKGLYQSQPIRRLSWAELKLSPDTPKTIRDCWNVFVSGGFCNKPIPPPKDKYFTEHGTLDILKYVRWVSKTNGLVIGRQLLEQKLAESDNSQGELKARILKTTVDKDLTYPDSFSTIPPQEREKIGVYLVLGIGGENSPNAALVLDTAEQIKKMGFQSEMLKVDANRGSEFNAKLLQDLISQRLPTIEKAIFVAVSKGAADFITYFFNYGETLPMAEREKVKLMVTLSGVIRPAIVAKYISETNRPIPALLKSFLVVSGRKAMIEGIRSLTQNPWKDRDKKLIHKLFPNMKWISLPTLPEGDEAVTHLSLWEGFLKTPTYHWAIKSSPMDGLVESAASVLPPDTDIPEAIIPVYGPHAMALGFYNKELRVAPVAMNGVFDRVVPAAGGEVLSAMFRALPQDLIK
ncbi:MAG: hypothetical protein JNM39_07915 [Bdellovibrionaceae bacterium]|nr:hypothetical protein [Pseudobdellovibrionaceae bacterium]